MHYTLLSEVFPPRHGGSGRWLYEIYRRQNPATVRAIVAEVSNDSVHKRTDQPESWIKRIDFDVTETGAFSMKGYKNYRQLIGEIKPLLKPAPNTITNCIHAARALPEGWLAYLLYRKMGIPFLCYAHGEEINLHGSEASGVMSSRQHRWMAKIVFRAAKKVIANSLNTQQVLVEQWRVPPSKVVVMNPGVDASFFCPSLPPPVASDTNQVQPPTTLLTVGRLQKRKGQDQVIRALPLIREEFPDIRYIIAGDGEERRTLKELSKACDVQANVIWKPNCTDAELLELYQRCDLFILANRQIGSDVEGFGMVLLEAAACGKATITCDSGGTKEAVEDGVTGVVLTDSNEKRIADSVCELLADVDKREKFGAAGRQRVVDKFDWNILSEQFKKSVN